MADQSQFGASGKGAGKTGKAGSQLKLSCAECEALLPDVMDGTVTAEQAAAFDAHTGGCRDCGRMVAEAQRGKAWLELLKSPEPEPPAGLVESILLKTTLAPTMPAQRAAAQAALAPGMGLVGDGRTLAIPAGRDAAEAGGAAGLLTGKRKLQQPAWKSTQFVAMAQTMRRTVFEPRLALTAAMAFFSISLTLNVAGIHLSDVKASDLKPQNLRRTITRSYSDTTGRVERYYYNLRFVYEMESRVRELRRAAETTERPANTPQEQDKTKQQDKKSPEGQPGGGATSDGQQPRVTNRLASDEVHRQGGKPAQAPEAPKVRKAAPAVPAGEVLEATVPRQHSLLEPETRMGQVLPVEFAAGPGRMGPGRMGPGRMGPGRMGPGRMRPGRMRPGSSPKFAAGAQGVENDTQLEKESTRATSERRPACIA